MVIELGECACVLVEEKEWRRKNIYRINGDGVNSSREREREPLCEREESEGGEREKRRVREEIEKRNLKYQIKKNYLSCFFFLKK